jgi:hypothetical protein
MKSVRFAAVPIALAAAVMWGCNSDKNSTSNLVGNITCSAADQSVCPPSNLRLGLNSSAGTPTIAPLNTSLNFSVSNSAYDAGGTTNSTVNGYWFVVVGGTLRAWGVVSVAAGAYEATIPLFCGGQAIVYRFDNNSGQSFWAARVTLSGCSTELFRAQLTWDTGSLDTLNSDIDLHLVRPGGSTNTSNDCYYANCKSGLEWGATGPAGDPYLDVDNVVGYGPENITIGSGPESGTYRVIVRNFSGIAGTHATVKLYFNGVEQARYTSQVLDVPNNTYWTVANVDIQNQVITAVNTYSSTAPAAPGVPAGAGARVK